LKGFGASVIRSWKINAFLIFDEVSTTLHVETKAGIEPSFALTPGKSLRFRREPHNCEKKSSKSIVGRPRGGLILEIRAPTNEATEMPVDRRVALAA
jgi:hypothetical protein